VIRRAIFPLRRGIFWVLIYPTLDVGQAQAWIAQHRKAAVGTRRWGFWLALWLPVRLVFVALFRLVEATA
jgi:hypothetical protein